MNRKTGVILRTSLTVIQILFLIPILWFIYHMVMPRLYTSKKAEVIPLHLSSGDFETQYYPADHPKGVMIVATGDGGWSGQWEEPVALHAVAAGYAVGGWDCRKFANTRTFDQAKLVEAFKAAADAVRGKAGLPSDTPVWYAGWSTGAEWAINAAAGPAREKHLVGILAVSPGDRSRYGLKKEDLLGLKPQGPDTYALADLAPKLHGLRIVQFSGEFDPLDDVGWIRSMDAATPHKVVKIPRATHDMNGAGARFLSEFDMAIQWMLDTPVTGGK
jgi:pimeloyl-ACP methyl ester carboxylesterase